MVGGGKSNEPAFGPERISNEELDLLVAYAESLDAEVSHSEPSAPTRRAGTL